MGYDQVFLCTSFVSFLGGGTGKGPKVNCMDCATIVTTFANCLGCALTSSRMMSPYNTGFDCNKMQVIGYTTWAYPFNGVNGGSFRYHEVAWTALASDPDPMYDACLKLDSGTDPWDWTDPSITHTPVLALAMPFSTLGLTPALPILTPFTDQSYRERVATNDVGGIGSCMPSGSWPNTQTGRRRLT